MNLLRSFKSVGGVAVGFMAGIVWVAACGGGGTASIADTIAAAIDVSYDNDDSGLTAETVQAAIDELKADAYSDEAALAAVADQDLTLGAVTADSFTFAAEKTGYLSVPGSAFHPSKVSDGVNTNEYEVDGIALIGDAGGNFASFYTPVYLPDGATVTQMTVYGVDGGGGDATVTLIGSTGLADDTLASISPLANPSSDDTISNATIDNQTSAYFLQASGMLDNTFSINRVLITYTYTTPTF